MILNNTSKQKTGKCLVCLFDLFILGTIRVNLYSCKYASVNQLAYFSAGVLLERNILGDEVKM